DERAVPGHDLVALLLGQGGEQGGVDMHAQQELHRCSSSWSASPVPGSSAASRSWPLRLDMFSGSDVKKLPAAPTSRCNVTGRRTRSQHAYQTARGRAALSGSGIKID